MAGLPLVSNQYAAQTTATASAGGGFSLGKMLLGAAVIGGGIFLGLKTNVGKSIAKSIGNLVADNAGSFEKSIIKGGKEGVQSAMSVVKKGALDSDAFRDIIEKNIDEAVSSDHIQILANTLANKGKYSQDIIRNLSKSAELSDYTTLVKKIQDNALDKTGQIFEGVGRDLSKLDSDKITKLFKDYSLDSKSVMQKLGLDTKLGSVYDAAEKTVTSGKAEPEVALERILKLAKSEGSLKYAQDNAGNIEKILENVDGLQKTMIDELMASNKTAKQMAQAIKDYGIDPKSYLKAIQNGSVDADSIMKGVDKGTFSLEKAIEFAKKGEDPFVHTVAKNASAALPDGINNQYLIDAAIREVKVKYAGKEAVLKKIEKFNPVTLAEKIDSKKSTATIQSVLTDILSVK